MEKLDFNDLAAVVKAVTKRNNDIEELTKICERGKSDSNQKLEEFFDNNPELYDYLHSNFDMNEILPDFNYTPF